MTTYTKSQLSDMVFVCAECAGVSDLWMMPDWPNDRDEMVKLIAGLKRYPELLFSMNAFRQPVCGLA